MRKWLSVSFLLLLLNAAYIAAFPRPTIFYMGNVLLHVVLGLGVLALALKAQVRRPVLLISAAFGIFLIFTGATRQYHLALIFHVTTAIAGVAALIPLALRSRPAFRNAFIAALALLGLLPAGASLSNQAF